MKQKTIKTSHEVRDWIENNAHYEAWIEPATGVVTHMNLRNAHERLRIPTEIWKVCFIKASDSFDTRMYRWDFEAEAQSLVE